jgi:NAD(P)-dependent dehydrogenase (short-subunit alcohol dehydrogenase family)
MSRLAGRHALVTGGGSGIGAATARALAVEGAKVTIIGRDRAKLDSVAREIDGFAAVADVTDPAQVNHAFAAARSVHGPLAILVNNAGGTASAPFAKLSGTEWRAVLALNLDSLLHCTQAALEDVLAAPSGRIVNIASTAALKGYAYVAPYVAAKHGVVGLTRALATEFAASRMTVNAVCPGFTETPMAQRSIEQIKTATGRDAVAARAALERFNPQRRLIDPAEVAATVIWLCLPESSSINGQAIALAGGEVM